MAQNNDSTARRYGLDNPEEIGRQLDEVLSWYQVLRSDRNQELHSYLGQELSQATDTEQKERLRAVIRLVAKTHPLQPAYAEQKDCLRELIKHAANYHAALEAVDVQTQWLINREMAPADRRGWLSRQREETRRTELAARRALSHMPAYQGSDYAWHWLVGELIAIYEAGTGTQLTGVTREPDAEPGYDYTQPVVGFVSECAERVGIQKTNSAIGQAVAASLRRRKK